MKGKEGKPNDKKGLENQRKNLQQLELKNEKTLKEISVNYNFKMYRNEEKLSI